MVGGTTPPQSDSGEISRVLVLNLLWQSKRCSRTAQDISVLTTPFALIEGHPAVSVGQCSWKSSRKDGQVSGRPCCSSRRFRARIVNTDVAFENRCVPRVTASSSSPASSIYRTPHP